MRNHFRYSILLALCLVIVASLVYAQPAPIGTSQLHTYESNPTAYSKGVSSGTTQLTTASETSMYDGDLGSSGSIKTFTTASTAPTEAWFTLETFKNTPLFDPTLFNIAWVDLKIKYSCPAFTDDKFRIEYTVAPSTTYVVLQADLAGAAAKFDRDGIVQIRPWSNLDEVNDHSWSWDDIANLKVRFYFTKVNNWDSKTMYVNEAWLTIYDTTPPTSSTAMSIMPPSIMNAGPTSFFDVYVAGLTGTPGLWGYQATIKFNSTEMTVLDGEYWSYWPLTTVSPALVDNVNGVVSIAFSSFDGDLVGFQGTVMPLCRIYFTAGGGGAGGCVLDLIDRIQVGQLVYVTELKLAGQPTGFTPTLYDGWFGGRRVMSTQPPIILPIGDPTGSTWHELYPNYSNTYTLTSWIDNGDLDLSASDQIDMVDAAGWKYWFHVDEVTVTINWTFKAPDTGEGAAELVPPSREYTITDPRGTTWHQIYPTYSRTFTITSWTDNGNGFFDPSDQFDWQYDDDPLTTHNAHLDAVSTDIILSQKGEPESPMPEFPLGLGLVIAVAPAIPLVHLWRIRRRKR